MAITAGLVKELREKTGVGMMECKKALTESGGQMDKAILWLRENGMARAEKKAGRATAEGMVIVKTEGLVAAAVEVNCETDFVGKNEDFISFANECADIALKNGINDIDALKSQNMSSGTSVADTLTALIAKIGENLNLRRVCVIKSESGVVAGYSHMGGKIGSLVALENTTDLELAKDIAMHIAAAAPRYLNNTEIPAIELEQEKDLAKKKLLDEGKPEAMLEKILVGQMNKFYKEICLVDQPFVKEPKTSITQLLSKSGAEISSFKRFQLGEGVDRKEEDFASEVAKLTK